jgi:hypothetical protein
MLPKGYSYGSQNMQGVLYVDTAAEKLTKTVSRQKYTTMETCPVANSGKTLSRQRKYAERVSQQAAEIYGDKTRTSAFNRNNTIAAENSPTSVSQQRLAMALQLSRQRIRQQVCRSRDLQWRCNCRGREKHAGIALWQNNHRKGSHGREALEGDDSGMAQWCLETGSEALDPRHAPSLGETVDPIRSPSLRKRSLICFFVLWVQRRLLGLLCSARPPLFSSFFVN